MTAAILSFAIPGRVTFRCDAIELDERRDLEDPPPFAEWSAAYAAGYWSAEALLAIGLALGRWFEGPQLWLTRLRTAPGPVVLTIETGGTPTAVEQAALDAPWELLAYLEPGEPGGRAASNTAPVSAVDEPDPLARLMKRLGPVDFARAHHLAHDRALALSPVRRIGPPGQPLLPSPFRLSVVFMPAQPDGLNHLQADIEEAAIYRAVHGVGVDLAVEESGMLRGVAEMVARVGDCDVIQLSCHGAGGERPRLALEDELGTQLDATADDLSKEFGTKPRLLFLSACSTAAPAPTSTASSANALGAKLGSAVVWPLASDLCRRGWPAVLGWSISVSNSSAIDLAVDLYRQLALRAPLEEALAKVRTGPAWHKLRLFLGPTGGGKLVNGTRPRPDQPDFVRSPQFLDPATRRIPVAAPEIRFPYRRQLQRVMMAMRDGNYNGIVVHGGDELARATFAGRVLRRGDRDRSRVVVADDLDALAILQQIRVQMARREIDKIVTGSIQAISAGATGLMSALRSIIEGPGQTAGSGAFTLVLHGFDPIIDLATPPVLRTLGPEHMQVARALIRAFAGAATASRLLFLSAAPFSVRDEGGAEIADSLLKESLEQPDRCGVDS